MFFAGAVIGFLIILVVRQVTLILLRSRFLSAFYRKKPASTNVFFIVLEIWNIGLTLGFIGVRVVKLICISLVFIARVDTPILAPGVGRLGPIELDGLWFAFRKDVLIHEAHRHVYIERFGQLCLVKLRNPEACGSRAGAVWRLLFVLAVMPWLRKYRVLDDAVEEDEAMLEVMGGELGLVNMVTTKETKVENSERGVDAYGKDLRGAEVAALRRRNAFLEATLKSMWTDNKTLSI